MSKRITRRTFVGTTGAAAGAVVVGCKTPGAASQVKDDLTPGTIVRAAIHPAIGVARIGNSEEFYVGPEVTEPTPLERDAVRAQNGALKRQAARFRIYGYDAAGNVVAELTPDNAAIEWTVHVANKKAAWYRFLQAVDIPESKTLKCPRRNAGVTGAARKGLVLDPGPRTISGKNKSGAEFHFDGAKFLGETEVALGEVRTDDAGRLLFLSARGKSASPKNMPVFDESNWDTFNNADGWYDDSADGPVSASVKVGGQEIPVDGAWVIVAPPNYAPDVVGWRTLYDLLVDTYIDAGLMPFPDETSFTRDILPALKRLSGLQWVNKGFAKAYGKGLPTDFENPAVLAKLAQQAPSGSPDLNSELRNNTAGNFRPHDTTADDRKPWPWIYGDAFGGDQPSARNNLALSPVRARHFKRWANGQHVNDWDPDAVAPRTLDDVPLQARPATLDQAALHYCLADAFHPGCELTWPMRHASMYEKPFRIKRRPAGEAEPDYGDDLTQAIIASATGPLGAQGPGDLTKWMALPWQGDTAFCRSGYDPQYDPYLPTFWPARVPNQVLSQADYATAMNVTLPREKRLEAFARREQWTRHLKGSPTKQILQMITDFPKMGVVVAMPGVENDPDLPAVMLVEYLPPGMGLVAEAPGGGAGGGAAKSKGGGEVEAAEETDPVLAAGWESHAQYQQFRKRIRRLR